jgi:formate dehydrogenase maturation protein FdhE
VYYSSEDEVYRLYVCQVCQRYLKTLDQRKARREFSLPVERITSVDLDITAREQGYR